MSDHQPADITSRIASVRKSVRDTNILFEAHVTLGLIEEALNKEDCPNRDQLTQIKIEMIAELGRFWLSKVAAD